MRKPLSIKSNSIPGIRRRIRQRLEVLRFILDDVPEGDRDEAGDISVFKRVKGKWGLSEKDKPTLRHLAALARAACEENTLSWAIFARFLVDLSKPESEAREVVCQLLKNKNRLNADAKVKINSACSRAQEPDHKKTLTGLRKETKAGKTGFLLSSCWYLTMLREMNEVDKVINILNTGVEETEWIKKIINRLR